MPAGHSCTLTLRADGGQGPFVRPEPHDARIRIALTGARWVAKRGRTIRWTVDALGVQFVRDADGLVYMGRLVMGARSPFSASMVQIARRFGLAVTSIDPARDTPRAAGYSHHAGRYAA